MDQELKLIHKLGMITSTELGERMDKSVRSIIRTLNTLETRGEIVIMTFKIKHIRRRIYINGEIYNNFIKVAESKR